MTCIIIDTEPKSIDIIEKYVNEFPFLKLLHTFKNSVEAINFIYTNDVDLVLVDINMPNISGVQMAELFQQKTAIIFTSACSKYAIDGFEANAIDYLIKPFSSERFLKAVTKAMGLKALRENISARKPDVEKPLFIKSGIALYKLNLQDILFLKKEGNYFNIYLKGNKKVLIRMNFFDVFNYIPGNKFIRIHKSFIVNVNHIDLIKGHNLFISAHEIPIGLSYKNEVMKHVKFL